MDSTPSRRVYLITYSKANMEKVPSRELFADMLTRNIETSAVKVEYMSVCQESHKDGTQHFHAAVKLNGVKKWLPISRQVSECEGIQLNFQEDSAGYLKAYRYVCKSDPKIYHYNGTLQHPLNLDVGNSPKTSKAMSGTMSRRKKRQVETPLSTSSISSSSCSSSSSSSASSCDSTPRTTKPKVSKVQRLDSVQFSDLVSINKIKNLNQLYSVANKRKEAGQCDLAMYVLNRKDKDLQDMIRKTYLLREADELMERERLSRIDIIKSHKEDPQHSNDCLWLSSALEVLQHNDIHPVIFGTAIRDLLIQGRGKYRNIMIVGERNCAKTFMLKPLELIYKCFLNPAKDKYAWVGVDECEIILLQDLRWDSETISWRNFLQLLEGEELSLPAPKNHFATDITITGSNGIPVFATSKEKIKYSDTDHVENRMMDVRWKVFHFKHEISEEEQKDIPPCANCFSKLVFMGI